MVERNRDFFFKHLGAPFSVQPDWEHPDFDLVSNRVEDPRLKDLLKQKRFFLTVRQVPTCTAMTNLRRRIRTEFVPILQELGFPLLYRSKTERGPFRKLSGFKESASVITEDQKTFLSSLLSKINKENMSYLDPLYGDEEEEVPEVFDQVEYLEEEIDSLDDFIYTFDFMDPFDAIRTIHAQERLGVTQSEILVWPGGAKRITDQIPVHVLNRNIDKENEKQFKRKNHFSEIINIDTKMSVLVNHTHWGKHLSAMRFDPVPQKAKWANNLRKRIKFFLEGKPDPVWNNSQLERMLPLAISCREEGKDHEKSDYELRDPKSRAERFFQILRTIDGIFTQVYLGNLGAGWNWHLYDNFVLSQINNLLSDEFVDGVLLDKKVLENPTYYERLKTFRGKVKEAFLRNGEYPTFDAESVIFAGPVRNLRGLGESHYRTQLGAIMVQTRGVGTPPPIVVLKSKIKFLTTVSTPSEPLVEYQLKFVSTLVQYTLNEIPDHVFTGLQTKAGVNPTTSACMENLREEGGTSEHIRTIVREGKLGRQIKILDMETGKFLRFEKLEDAGIGTYIFWRCLEEVMSMAPDSLREAKVVMINEPGKSRTVTKAHAALKCILDTINGICSYPLKKGVESSSSGMSKSNHGWNSFTSFYGKNEIRNLIFSTKSREERSVARDVTNVTYTYDDCWMSFTDYSEATDKMDHKIASFVGECWMRKCGIPTLLRGIVHETCFKPRTIFFDATGILEGIGESTDSIRIRKITLRKGVLMGDPLTKVILHLMNKAVRDSGKVYSETENPFRKSAFEFDKIKRKLDGYLHAVNSM